MEMDFRTASDARLVVALGRYREEALAEIYRRHAGPVHGLAITEERSGGAPQPESAPLVRAQLRLL